MAFDVPYLERFASTAKLLFEMMSIDENIDGKQEMHVLKVA